MNETFLFLFDWEQSHYNKCIQVFGGHTQHSHKYISTIYALNEWNIGRSNHTNGVALIILCTPKSIRNSTYMGIIWVSFTMFLIGKKVFEKLRNQFNPRAREKIIRQFKNKNEDAVRQFFFAML